MTAADRKTILTADLADTIRELLAQHGPALLTAQVAAALDADREDWELADEVVDDAVGSLYGVAKQLGLE